MIVISPAFIHCWLTFCSLPQCPSGPFFAEKLHLDIPQPLMMPTVLSRGKASLLFLLDFKQFQMIHSSSLSGSLWRITQYSSVSASPPTNGCHLEFQSAVSPPLGHQLKVPVQTDPCSTPLATTLQADCNTLKITLQAQPSSLHMPTCLPIQTAIFKLKYKNLPKASLNDIYFSPLLYRLFVFLKVIKLDSYITL